MGWRDGDAAFCQVTRDSCCDCGCLSVLAFLLHFVWSVHAVQITTPPQNTVAVAGSVVQLTCGISETYTRYFEWRAFYAGVLGGEQIYHSPPFSSSSPRFREFDKFGLEINPVEWQDAGKYSCVFLTGDVRATASIVVLGLSAVILHCVLLLARIVCLSARLMVRVSISCCRQCLDSDGWVTNRTSVPWKLVPYGPRGGNAPWFSCCFWHFINRLLCVYVTSLFACFFLYFLLSLCFFILLPYLLTSWLTLVSIYT